MQQKDGKEDHVGVRAAAAEVVKQLKSTICFISKVTQYTSSAEN